MIRTNTQQYDILLYLLLPQSPTRPQCQPSCLEALSNLCPGFSSTRAYPKPSTGPPLPAGTEGIIIILNQVKRTKRITLNQVNNVSSKCFVNSPSKEMVLFPYLSNLFQNLSCFIGWCFHQWRSLRPDTLGQLRSSPSTTKSLVTNKQHP